MFCFVWFGFLVIKECKICGFCFVLRFLDVGFVFCCILCMIMGFYWIFFFSDSGMENLWVLPGFVFLGFLHVRFEGFIGFDILVL